jgi:hypothetical protein
LTVLKDARKTGLRPRFFLRQSNIKRIFHGSMAGLYQGARRQSLLADCAATRLSLAAIRWLLPISQE